MFGYFTGFFYNRYGCWPDELGHCEMICAMVNQLTKNASIKELEEAGLASYYADHNKGIYPVDASGVQFTATIIGNLLNIWYIIIRGGLEV